MLVCTCGDSDRPGTWAGFELWYCPNSGISVWEPGCVVGVEDAAIEAAHKLDFFKAAVLKGYVKSPRGIRYDLQIMTKRLHRSYGDF
jgi:hypothetical protein